MKPTKTEIAALVTQSTTDDGKLAELVAGLSSKDLITKQRSFLSLQKLVEGNPARLYQRHWYSIAAMLDHSGVDAKYIAIYLLAGMTAADADDRFDEVFYKYFSLLDDNTLIAPMHVALNAAAVHKAKPELREDIVKLLISIDKTHHTPARKALIAAYAIESLDKIFDDVEDKAAVLEFVRGYVKAPSPKARTMAKAFLKKREKTAV
ncbi:hypothetical protein [Dehalogenimonas sp. 4OHTPN]|uniref:HEAT repeat domain-containing protein n=1 Tax=Dehalogenimonas sp. 4OHTPN TaxID=3166643 RepID=A0AAU8GAG9_9CHLR